MTSKERSAIEDGAGNVRFCGEFLYAFDAWNRLVAVWKARRVDHATVLPSASAPLAGVEVGNWVKRLRYDALGRLIEVISPMAGPDWPDGGGKLERVERFWYDGSRRIQEVVIDPTDLLYVVHKYGTEGLVEYITTGLVNAETGPPTGVPFRALNREYIWGAGVGGGVDELHVYFDRERRPWGVLQDSDGDNVAVVDDGGAVVAEFVYDPYGAVIGQRTYGVGGHPPLKAGHRGLFAESLTVGTVGAPDVDLGDPESTVVAWVDGRVLVPNERVVYHMRNRAYDPGPSGATAGRFLQRDPNASGAVLYGGGGVGGLGSHGAAGGARVAPPDVLAHLLDGVNTYGYLAGRMRGAGDPSGLSTEELWRETRDGAMFLYNVYNTATAATDVGGLLGAMVESLTQTYSNGLSADVDWAFGWSRDDDDHARHDTRWVEIALIAGATRHWGMDYWDGLAEAEDDGPAMASNRHMAKAFRNRGGGYYDHLIHTGKVGAGRPFTKSQRDLIIAENRKRNGGKLICDVTGVEMTTVPGQWNSIEIDHRVPRMMNGKPTGPNAFWNAQAVIRQYNGRKGNRWIDP